jgi:hypothetical protein
MLAGASTATTPYITSVTGGGTWVLPGTSGCQMQPSGGLGVSCAYALSSTSGATSLTIKAPAGTYGFSFWEVSRTGGSFVLDQLATQTNAASTWNAPGPALSSATGTNDIIFQLYAPAIATTGAWENYYGIFPGKFINLSTSLQAGNSLVINTNNFAATTWNYSNGSNLISSTAALAFK